jgi:hypothetical protein
MDQASPRALRLALIDLDWADLDAFRGALANALKDAGEDPLRALEAEVRLVVAQGPDAPSFHWARLAGAPRAGEVARLSEVVVDAVILSARSPRASSTARLSAALGALVIALPGAQGAFAAGARK